MSISVEEYLKKETPADDSICDIVLEVIKSRKLQGLSQQELAQKAEVDVPDIVYLESLAFERVSLGTLSKILEALELKLKIDKKEGC